MAAAAPVYRRVLKAVQKHVGGGASKQHFRDFVAAEFRAPAGTEADARARLRLAGDYAYLLTSVHHHKVGDKSAVFSISLVHPVMRWRSYMSDEMPKKSPLSLCT